jgi:ribosomal protein S10
MMFTISPKKRGLPENLTKFIEAQKQKKIEAQAPPPVPSATKKAPVRQRAKKKGA